MTTSDKIIIGSTVVIAASAITMLVISNKYDTTTKATLSELQDLNRTMVKTHADVLIGNEKIEKSNILLQKLVTKSAEDRVRKSK